MPKTIQRFATLITTFFLLASSGIAQVSDLASRNEGGTQGLDGEDASFQGVGDLPGGGFSSAAVGVSADGSVVVGSSNAEEGSEAFRWTESDGMVSLGVLPGGSIHISQASATSADGSVVVGLSFSELCNTFEAFRWTETGGMVGLGEFPDAGCAEFGSDVSADGSVVVGSGEPFDPNETGAFRWEDGVLEALGDFPGGAFVSRARGVSADGSVIVGHGTHENGLEAFRWVAVEDPALGGGDPASRYEGGPQGFAGGKGGTMQGLGDLPGGDFDSRAYGVSADGSVVVGNGHSENGQEAFRWTEAGGMRNLKAVLEDDHGLDLTGWTLTHAAGVSADGTVIVGTSTNPDGNTETFRAVLPNAGQPVADISPESFTFEVEEGESDGDALTISNTGTADLEWSIAGGEIWSDNVDDYELGSNIHGQGGWKGWGNNPEVGALVSADVSRSTPHAVKLEDLENTSGSLVREFDELGIDSGQWTISAWQFHPDDFDTSHATWFNLLHSYDDSGTDSRSTVVQFRRFNEGPQNFFRVFNAGISGGSLPVATGEWVELRVEIDLDADTQEFWYGDALLFSGTWTDEYGDGSLRFDTILLQASSMSPVYYDDLSITLSECEMPEAVSWLSVDPASGVTAPGASSEVSVMVSAEGLKPSEEPYTTNLCVATNDPERQVTAVPVSLTVLPTVGAEEEAPGVEGQHELSAVVPNPAAGTAMTTLRVKTAQDVRVEVFDMNGRRVAVPFEGTVAVRSATDIALNTSSLAPGVYVVRVAGEDFAETRRVTVVR